MDTQPVVFESELSCVCPDSAGNFLIGTEEGIIYRYAPGSLEQYRVTNPSTAFTILKTWVMPEVPTICWFRCATADCI